MLSRKVFSTLRAVWVVSMLATLLVFDNIPAVVSCSGPSPNPQTAATAAGTCAAAKVQQQLSSAANTVTSNVEPFGVPKDKTSPAFKAKATTTTAQVPTTSPILVRGGALVETTSSDEVDEIVQEASINELLVVIDFTASWCGPCKGECKAKIYVNMGVEYAHREYCIDLL
jgi:thiol-disulfide isomerase/thioredoxin